MKYILKGKEIINLRHRKNLSQDQLATLVGFTGPSSIGRIEKGTRPVDWDKLEKIAKALEVNPESLIETEAKETVVLRPENIEAIRKALSQPVKLVNHYDQESFDDLLKRVESLEKIKTTTLSGDGLSAEERELIKMFRASSEPQRKAALAAAKAILSETL